MNKIIKILIIIAIIISIFTIGYFIPFWKQKSIPSPIPIEDLKPLPYGSESYIKDGILYTSVAVIPIIYITKVTLNTDTIATIIIEYKFNNYRAGILAMSYAEYKKLFGENNGKN